MARSVHVRRSAPARTGQGAGDRSSASTVGLVGLVGLGTASTAITFAAAYGGTVGWWAPIPRVAWAPPVIPVALLRSLLYLAVTVGAVVVWTRRHEAPVRSALVLFVAQQVLATVWPVVFFAGFSWVSLAGIWVTVALLLLLDLLLAGTASLFWPISRPAAVAVGLDLGLTLFVTGLIVGSAGEHAVL